MVGAESGWAFRYVFSLSGQTDPRYSQLGTILEDPGLPLHATDGETEKRRDLIRSTQQINSW